MTNADVIYSDGTSEMVLLFWSFDRPGGRTPKAIIISGSSPIMDGKIEDNSPFSSMISFI